MNEYQSADLLCLGTEEKQIISVLVSHSLAQRLQIKSKYTTLFGKVRSFLLQLDRFSRFCWANPST